MSKLSELNPITLPLQSGDEIYVIRAGQEYRVDLTEMRQNFIKFVPGYEGYLIIPGPTNTNMDIVQTNDILIGKGAFFSGEYVMMRATTNNPALDADFKLGYRGEEQP